MMKRLKNKVEELFVRKSGEPLLQKVQKIEAWIDQVHDDIDRITVQKPVEQMSYFELLVLKRNIERFYKKYVRRNRNGN